MMNRAMSTDIREACAAREVRFSEFLLSLVLPFLESTSRNVSVIRY